MKRFKNYFGIFFDRVMADDTDILEAASGVAGIGFALLMSPHDVDTYLSKTHTLATEIMFRASVLIGATGQIISVYYDDLRGRRAAAFGALFFWIFVSYILWSHRIMDVVAGKIGHPSAMAAFAAFALGNALTYIKLGRTNAGNPA